MIGLLILWATLAFSTLFLLFSSEGSHSYFPFSDMLLNPQNYVYFLFEHVNQVLVPIGVYLARKYVLALLVFVGLHLIDTADYLLTYSTPWFNIPLTMNTIKVSIFGLTILYEKYGKQ